MDSDDDEQLSRAQFSNINPRSNAATQNFKNDENFNNSNFSTLQQHQKEIEPVIVSGDKCKKESSTGEKRVAFSP